MEPYQLTIAQAHQQLIDKQLTSEALTRSVLARIEAIDPQIGAFITVMAEQSLDQARQADKRIASGRAGMLTGIPIGIKDLICTRGVRTTCGSRILENFIPPYNATVIEKLNQAGAVLVGKLNMDEFAMGSSTENSAFHVTRNPWDRQRIPGGSSGGSAAAVAADLCLAAIGSDTGGSIRQPAAHCGVVGLKPTYGRVSRFGLVAFASSLDQIGPLTKNVADSAAIMNVIAGHDARDSTSVPKDVPNYLNALNGESLDGMKIGIAEQYQSHAGMDAEVAQAVERAIDVLQERGATCVPVSLPHSDYAIAAYYIIAPAEASSNLARYDGVKYGFRDPAPAELMQMYRNTRSAGFGAEVQRRILLGTYVLSAGYYDAYYGKASQVRTLIRNDFKQAFADCDVIAAPVTPTPAFRLGENVDDPLTMYLSDIFTLAINLAGLPGMSVPCGFTRAGLPIGLQLIGNHFDESRLLRVAHHYEQATEHHRRRPAIDAND